MIQLPLNKFRNAGTVLAVPVIEFVNDLDSNEDVAAATAAANGRRKFRVTAVSFTKASATKYRKRGR